MSAFPPLPLGQPIPDCLHGVSCSLPTMRDVIGYEEKNPAVTAHLDSGYPRFVVHRFNRQLATLIATELSLSDHDIWLTCSARVATALVGELSDAHTSLIHHDGVHGVAHRRDPDLFNHAKRYLQNIGGFLSSREAEDRLAARGLIAVAPETLAPTATAATTVREVLTQAHAGARHEDILLAPSGMNAFHGAWRSLAALQAERGRTVWIQLGWLYLDTIAQLRRFTASPADYVNITDVNDLTALDEALAAAGNRLAGLVTEVPTNPLVQTADIAAVARKVHAAGGRVLLDPTLVSPFNIRLLEHSDVVVNSLTKYAANEGDVIAGSVIINPAGSDAAALRHRIAAALDPVYPRDLARLAAQVPAYESTVLQTNRTAIDVVEFLRQHPAVREVYWSLQPATAENYLKIARSPAHIGSMISFTLRRPLAEVYDRLPLAKGPSFGMQTSLICPFIYLAHYDLVTTPEGRAQLAAAGIDYELLRLSVGTEPVSEIIAALESALSAPTPA
ncbi:PLP-dependent transferase [Synoicihabitans lomoniglobus]|uniref:PLP-dependent transferase n=1 Tax=Synoicihabitans lomoniglobus TaxID=2909285 RepID=A0AAF0CN05_9BACT|nr:PLP-dependent transferase [Opitutaceae bacterium LMO-M01]WED63800.1 PLP-dependent transferase [Opitutaceae bacterium LMO-M01]